MQNVSFVATLGHSVLDDGIPPVALRWEFHECDCLWSDWMGSSIDAATANVPWTYWFAMVAVVDSSSAQAHCSMAPFPDRDSMAFRQWDWAIAASRIPFEMACEICLYLSATMFFSLTFLNWNSSIAKLHYITLWPCEVKDLFLVTRLIRYRFYNTSFFFFCFVQN